MHISGATGASSVDRGRGLRFAALPIAWPEMCRHGDGRRPCMRYSGTAQLHLAMAGVGGYYPMHQAGA